MSTAVCQGGLSVSRLSILGSQISRRCAWSDFCTSGITVYFRVNPCCYSAGPDCPRMPKTAGEGGSLKADDSEVGASLLEYC